jgi:multidrug efflux system membrane fusion protein
MASTQLSDPPAPPTLSSTGAPLEPERKKGSRLRTVIVVLVIVLAVGGTIWKIRSNAKADATTNNRANAAAADRPQPVLVTPVAQKTMPIYISALGTVTPYYSVTIKSRVDGQLMSVNVREGQAVRKGQLLAEIDPRPYQAALAQAQGQLVKDQATADNAKVQAQRYTALLDAGVVSKESQQTQLATAGQAEGSIAADQAAIQAANVNLAYTKITSPIDGVVGLRQVDPGNIVHSSDASGLMLVTQLQPISIIFTLPEDQLPQVLKLVRSGQKLPVEAYDRSETTLLGHGTVLTADNQIDATTGTDRIKAVFGNKDDALFPNQFVNVRLILQQRPNALVVPAQAVQTGSQGSFVFIAKPGNPPAGSRGAGANRSGGARGGARAGDGQANNAANSANSAAAGEATTAQGPGNPRAGGAGGGRASNTPPYYVVAQPVTVDVTEGSQVILTSGVKAGDQVVVDGQEKLLDGSRVIPRLQEQVPGAAGRKPTTESGTSTAAFGPEGAGPAESPENPRKQGIETGHGVPDTNIRPGGNGQNGPRGFGPGASGQNGPRGMGANGQSGSPARGQQPPR